MFPRPATTVNVHDKLQVLGPGSTRRQQHGSSRFMTDPHAMRGHGGPFEAHAQTVEGRGSPMRGVRAKHFRCGLSGAAEATR